MKNEERILSAALAVVKEHTISGTRMHLIAEKAGMVQSNLHYYFKSKSDIMYALQRKVLEKCLELRQRYRKRMKADTLENELDVFIAEKKDFIIKYREYDYAEMDFWAQGRIDEETRLRFAESFSGWRDEIRIMLEKYAEKLSDESKEYLPYMIVSFLEGATIQYLVDENIFNLDNYFEFGKKIILKSIKEEEGDNDQDDIYSKRNHQMKQSVSVK